MRSRSPDWRTLPSRIAWTFSRRPICRASIFRPLKANEELWATTRKPGTFVSPLMISSERPSQKSSLAAIGAEVRERQHGHRCARLGARVRGPGATSGPGVTIPTNLYPSRGTVLMKRGRRASSPSACRASVMQCVRTASLTCVSVQTSSSNSSVRTAWPKRRTRQRSVSNTLGLRGTSSPARVSWRSAGSNVKSPKWNGRSSGDMGQTHRVCPAQRTGASARRVGMAAVIVRLPRARCHAARGTGRCVVRRRAPLP
jgi:hypothetical protein